MAFGSKLKELRLKKGQSLQQVADAVEASKAHIWELETGKSRNPSLGLIKRLADHFKISVATLIGETPSDADDFLVMFRDMQSLDEDDRRMIQVLIDGYKQRSKEKASGEN